MSSSQIKKYFGYRLIALLFWKLLTWKIWSFFTNIAMQLTLYRISRKMDVFLASRRMSAMEYRDHYENFVLFLYGWSFSRYGFGARAFLKQLYQRVREERALNNKGVVYG